MQHTTSHSAIPHRAITSSLLASVGYRPDTETLEVRFHSGAVYQYFNVPAFIYHGLLGATSCGRFFNQHIRHHFPYKHTASPHPITPATKPSPDL